MCKWLREFWAVRTTDSNKSCLRHRPLGRKGWATSIFPYNYLKIKLSPKEGQKIKRKNNIQSSRKRLRSDFMNTALERVRVNHSPHPLEREQKSDSVVFFPHRWFLVKHKEDFPERKYMRPWNRFLATLWKNLSGGSNAHPAPAQSTPRGQTRCGVYK